MMTPMEEYKLAKLPKSYNHCKQNAFRAEPEGYLMRQVTTADGHSINPPERIAPVVRNNIQYKRTLEFDNIHNFQPSESVDQIITPKSTKSNLVSTNNKTPIIIFRHVPDAVVTGWGVVKNKSRRMSTREILIL